MLTTIELLKKIQIANENCTNYRVAKLMGVSMSTVSRWAHGQSTMDDKRAFQAAQMLGIDPKYAVVCVNAERNIGRENYDVWQYICHTIEDENARRDKLKH